MFLKEFEFTDKSGKKINWKIRKLKLGNKNLIVGRNAVGKTRTLFFIMNFVKLLNGLNLLIKGSFEWKITFDIGGSLLKYHIKMEDNNVIGELLEKDNKKLLKRDNKETYIYSKIKDKNEFFTPPENKLAITVRRKEEEYPEIERLFEWAEKLYCFSFSGMQRMQTSIPWVYEILFEPLSKMVDIIEKNLKKQDFKNTILEDLNKIGYEIKDIYEPIKTSMGSNIIINIREKSLNLDINQHSMSAGMFRAFSILVLFNYYLLEKKSCTLIVDDLGEGLDFDRVSKLIGLLFDKIEDSHIQLIVTSNDRFLMNAVDLKYWNILDRKGHIVTSYNYENSKDTFEGFSFTGLNNFDFFALEFYKGDNND
jgi:hypothetical protein